MVVSLVIFPGRGLDGHVVLEAGASLQDLVNKRDLSGRSLCVNGEEIPSSAWESTILESGWEVAALSPSKGN
jgi:sulfur carrier protein ThiS